MAVYLFSASISSIYSRVLLSRGILCQRVVQDACKALYIVRHLGKLYQPLVAAFGVGIHEDRCGRVFQYLRTRFGAGACQTFLGIVHDELLAESVDEVLRAAGDDEFVRMLARELHRIAYQVAPQARRGGDDHGVVLAQFHFLQAIGVRVLLVDFLQGDKFKEDTIVYHQQHGRIGRVVLRAEIAFGGVVRLHIVHLRAADNLLVLFAIGCEGHSAVEEHFQVGPHFFQRLPSRFIQDMLDEHQHPRRHAGQVGHVRADGLSRNSLHLRLEFAHQGRLFARHADEVDQRGDVFYEDGAEVAHQAMVGVQVGGMAAAQYQPFSGEETAFGILTQVDGHGILSAPVVRIFEGFPADGDKLALVVGGAR